MLSVASAQLRPADEDISRNIREHIRLIESAAENRAEARCGRKAADIIAELGEEDTGLVLGEKRGGAWYGSAVKA